MRASVFGAMRDPVPESPFTQPRRACAIILALAATSACGSRTGLSIPDASPPRDVEPAPVDAGPPPPRLISPLSTMSVRQTRPTLRWTGSDGYDAVRVYLCRDRWLTTGCLDPIDVRGDSVRPAAALAPGWWFWRVRGLSGGTPTSASRVWQFHVGLVSGPLDTRWGSQTDFDGDGYPECVSETFGTDTTILIFHGSSDGPVGPPAMMALPLVGVPDVHSAGDLNGDGFVDLVLLGDLGDSVTVFVYAGGTTFVPTMVSTFVDHWDEAVPADDVDGDGYADVVAIEDHPPLTNVPAMNQLVVFAGSPRGVMRIDSTVLLPDNDYLRALINLDANGDGFGDVVSTSGMTNTNFASLVLGGNSGPQQAIGLAYPDSSPGGLNPLFAVGDVNGDGYGDMLRGTAINGISSEQERIHEYDGDSSGLVLSSVIPAAGLMVNEDAFLPIDGRGDVNGDGFDDVVVTVRSDQRVPNSLETNTVVTPYLLFGTASGLVGSAVEIMTPMPERGFNIGVSNFSDFNGDGYADLQFEDGHATYIYFGGPSGPQYPPIVLAHE